MAGLDINTPKGQRTLQQEKRAAEIICKTWPGCVYIGTPKRLPADVDAIIARDNQIAAVAEMKCRAMSLRQLRDFNNEWLVTFDKLTKGQIVADALQVDFWGFLYLEPDDLVMRAKLYAPSPGWVTPFRVHRTVTQKTVNGGSITRANAYIDMSMADVLRDI